jgi:hypothetical protein
MTSSNFAGCSTGSLLSLGHKRRGEEAESEGDCERRAPDHHAATDVRWLNTPRRSNPRYFGPNTSMAIRPALTAQGQPA